MNWRYCHGGCVMCKQTGVCPMQNSQMSSVTSYCSAGTKSQSVGQVTRRRPESKRINRKARIVMKWAETGMGVCAKLADYEFIFLILGTYPLSARATHSRNLWFSARLLEDVSAWELLILALICRCHPRCVTWGPKSLQQDAMLASQLMSLNSHSSDVFCSPCG